MTKDEIEAMIVDFIEKNLTIKYDMESMYNGRYELTVSICLNGNVISEDYVVINQ